MNNLLQQAVSSKQFDVQVRVFNYYVEVQPQIFDIATKQISTFVRTYYPILGSQLQQFPFVNTLNIQNQIDCLTQLKSTGLRSFDIQSAATASIKEMIKNTNDVPELELIKPDLKFFTRKMLENASKVNDYGKYLQNKNYRIVAEDVFEERINDKVVYRKIIYVIIGGILCCFLVYFFWVYFCRSGRLSKMWENFKALFKIPDIVTELPDISDQEELEDLIAKVKYFFLKQLEQEKLINILPQDIYELCLQKHNFKNKKKFISCVYNLFDQLLIKKLADEQFYTCATNAIERYSAYVVKICKAGSSKCTKSLLEKSLQEIYGMCLEFIIHSPNALKYGQRYSYLCDRDIRRYEQAYEDFLKSEKTWLDRDD